MKTNRQLLMIGLPGTGKTSFLAALWHTVNEEGDDCQLKLDHLDGDSAYLNKIRKRWLEYKPVPRTRLQSNKTVAMVLKDRASEAVIRLVVPDLSGELFLQQWVARQFTKAYDQQLRESSGAVLFLHPANVIKPYRIDMLDELVEAQGDVDVVVDEHGPEDSGATVPWDAEKSPTQVQVVELFQFIGAREPRRLPFRVALVVSAWDLIQNAPNPRDWINGELPLLSQFLAAHSTLFETRAFGLSAQGGRYPSWLFDIANVKDALFRRLTHRTRKIDTWLWEQLGSAIQDPISDNNTAEPEFRRRLVDRLNRMISEKLIYEGDRFDGVVLRDETQEILGGRVDDREEMVRVNRCLLEDAFPTELSRERRMEGAMANAQDQLPIRRILLVDENGRTSNDVTEPVQWLMN